MIFYANRHKIEQTLFTIRIHHTVIISHANIKMLKHPIYKERYPADLDYTRNNIAELSTNPSPEAMLIVYQYLNEFANGNHSSENEFVNPVPQELLTQNIFWNTHSRDIRIVECEQIENLELWGECKKILYETEDWSVFKHERQMKKWLLTIPCAIDVVKQIYSYNDIFNDTRDAARFVSNRNSAELLTHYNYDMATCNRYVLDHILHEPHLIYLVYTWDFNAMCERNWPFKEELVSKVFAPRRMLNICEDYGVEFDELMEMY